MTSATISPSILSADFSQLGAEIKRLNDMNLKHIHIDVMDGVFVPTLSFGDIIVKSIRQHTKSHLDIHLMVTEPDRYIEPFVAAGADSITVHVEACTHLDRTLTTIKSLGKKAGVALNPTTPPNMLPWILDKIDRIVVMTVNPGFMGQLYLPSQEQKIRQIRSLIKDTSISLQVDGGINNRTIIAAREAGANDFVTGSYLFSGDPQQKLNTLLEALNQSKFPSKPNS